MIILIFCTKQLHSNMRQATCLKDEVHVFCFSIDENKQKKEKKRGGGEGWFWSRISENKKKSKSRFTEIKICHF